MGKDFQYLLELLLNHIGGSCKYYRLSKIDQMIMNGNPSLKMFIVVCDWDRVTPSVTGGGCEELHLKKILFAGT